MFWLSEGQVPEVKSRRRTDHRKVLDFRSKFAFSFPNASLIRYRERQACRDSNRQPATGSPSRSSGITAEFLNAMAPNSTTDGDAKRAGDADSASNGNPSSPSPTALPVGENLAQVGSPYPHPRGHPSWAFLGATRPLCFFSLVPFFLCPPTPLTCRPPCRGFPV